MLIRRSQVGLCLSNEHALDSVKAFHIHKLPINFSDHAPISAELVFDINSTIPTNYITSDLLSNNGEDAGPKPCKITTNINWDAYVNTASRDLNVLKGRMDNIEEYTQDTVDDIVNNLSAIISKSAHAHKEEINEAEFIPEIHNGRSIQQISNDVSSKEIQNWNNILNNKDSKELWSKINWKDSKSQTNMSYPSAEALGEHFQEKSKIQDEIPFTFKGPNHVPVLDNPISDGEIDKASKKLKEGKSTADGMSPKHITSISGVMFTILSILMNVILSFSIYPSQWRTTIVSAIFKNKGCSLFPKFYRPISLVQLLSKFFDFIMLDRFTQ